MIVELVCILACAAPPPIDPKAFGENNPAAFVPARSKSGSRATLNLRNFSSALSRAELADRIAKLPIAEAARQALVSCAAEQYSTFIAVHDEVVARHAQRYFEMSGDLVAHREATGEDPTVDMYREQIKEAMTIQRELITAEQGFIQSVQDCFSKSDAATGQDPDILEPFRLRSEYRYAALDRGSDQRGTDLDLRSFIDQLNVDLLVRQNLEPELRNYERSLAALKPAQNKAYWDRSPRIRSLLKKSEAGVINGSTCAAQINQVAAACGNIGVQIRNETLATVARIIPKLPTNAQGKFERMVHKAIFPEIHNDRAGDSLRESFDIARARRDLSSDTIRHIESMQETWSLEFAAWRAKIEAALLEWSDGDTRGIRKYDSESLSQMLTEQFQNLADLHDRWRLVLADQLPTPTK